MTHSRLFGSWPSLIALGALFALGTAASAAAAGGSPGCATGTVTWTATTSSPGAAGSQGAVPGATYTGTASDGASVSVTVSGSGTTVSSYEVLGIFGTDTNGQQCQGTAEQQPGGWAGAAISGDGWQDAVTTSFDISGTFDAGARTLSGSFDLDQVATSSSGGGGGSGATGGAGGSGGSAGAGASGKKSFRVRVSLRRHAQVKLLGSLKASSSTCTARRMVYLWSGHRRLRSTRTSKKGAFTFRARKAWHGRRVYATVREMSTKAATCSAGSSGKIRG